MNLDGLGLRIVGPPNRVGPDDAVLLQVPQGRDQEFVVVDKQARRRLDQLLDLGNLGLGLLDLGEERQEIDRRPARWRWLDEGDYLVGAEHRRRNLGTQRHVGQQRLRLLAAGHAASQKLLLGVGVVKPKQGPRIPELALDLTLLLDQPVDDPLVGRLRACARDEVAKVRGLALAEAIDAPVALGKADDRPGHVVVKEVVALVMEVHAFGGGVRAEQEAQGAVRVAK
jgi:hypothetical protein